MLSNPDTVKERKERLMSLKFFCPLCFRPESTEVLSKISTTLNLNFTGKGKRRGFTYE